MRIPASFMHPLFFSKDEITVETAQPFPNMMKHVPFYYDITEEEQPWTNMEQSLPPLLELWKDEKETLASLFAKRDRKAAREPMIRSLAYFLSALFWLNERKVSNVCEWEKEVKALPLQPLNCLDRLAFIFARPDLYHSFIQLDELFEELTKLVYKTIAKRKITK
ncbi:hypothetical protein EDD69_101227 [Thermolongibacillus altinsuensis]|uniref:YpoC-like domain-containing protein n=1 Tax=Thermolongibacillus altinsuensis TaxID=575256 RepID=A0A4R1QI06_9BACL|nr:hypothetical protein [Thermolongibacillus altinsuensis]TCL53219.1 hypothetical protein EDD69_101227 [Thermolongibacillus altinsuensis]GMB07914.1 hypothetical protein B1no1_06240 [Thermolongibacillus altinsuensis]